MEMQITFRNMARSEAVESAIRDKAFKLDSFYDRILTCRVVVEAPHRRHRKGKAYQVRIDLSVLGTELVINRAPKRLKTAKSLASEKELVEAHEPSKHAAHADIYVAIRDAFNAVERKLQDFARRRSGGVKPDNGQPRGRVKRLFPEAGYGFLETPEGREIYFHSHSVLQPGFNRLDLDSEVYFAEEERKKDLQASTVQLVSK
jgi:cold shock CspA family protein/ribosome-associated translation inhibitor RaiA